jgi:hypothetical protein
MTPIALMRPLHHGQRSSEHPVSCWVALPVIGGDRGRCHRLRDRQQTAAMGELGSAPAVSEKAVVADAMETVGQGVEQEAADELVCAKGHHLLLVVVAIILAAEADPALGERDQATVGDGDAMGISAEILEHLLGSTERRFSIVPIIPELESRFVTPTIRCIGRQPLSCA